MNKEPKPYITVSAVLRLLPFSATRTWLEQKAADPTFPVAKKSSPKKTVYERAAVLDWIALNYPTTQKPTLRPAAAPRNREKV